MASKKLNRNENALGLNFKNERSVSQCSETVKSLLGRTHSMHDKNLGLSKIISLSANSFRIPINDQKNE